MDKEILLKSINLSSYSFSSGWIGYFEAEVRRKPDICDKAVDLLNKMLPAKKYGVPQIWTSLHFPEDIEYVASLNDMSGDDLAKKVMPLVDMGCLRLVDFSTADEDYTDEEYEKFGDDLDRDFRVEMNPDPSFLRDSCLAVMKLSGVLGHCFVFYEEFELFAYPHDDGGFGFIFSINASEEQKSKFKEILWREITDDFLLFDRYKLARRT